MLFAHSFTPACMFCRDSSFTANWSRCLSSCGGSVLLPLACCCSFLQATTARGFSSASASKKVTPINLPNETKAHHVPCSFRVCLQTCFLVCDHFKRCLDQPSSARPGAAAASACWRQPISSQRRPPGPLSILLLEYSQFPFD